MTVFDSIKTYFDNFTSLSQEQFLKYLSDVIEEARDLNKLCTELKNKQEEIIILLKTEENSAKGAANSFETKAVNARDAYVKEDGKYRAQANNANEIQREADKMSEKMEQLGRQALDADCKLRCQQLEEEEQRRILYTKGRVASTKRAAADNYWFWRSDDKEDEARKAEREADSQRQQVSQKERERIWIEANMKAAQQAQQSMSRKSSAAMSEFQQVKAAAAATKAAMEGLSATSSDAEKSLAIIRNKLQPAIEAFIASLQGFRNFFLAAENELRELLFKDGETLSPKVEIMKKKKTEEHYKKMEEIATEVQKGCIRFRSIALEASR